jgi:hypothetical protein
VKHLVVSCALFGSEVHAVQQSIHRSLDFVDATIAARTSPWYRGRSRARSFLRLPLVINGKPFGLVCAGAAAQAGSIAVS